MPKMLFIAISAAAIITPIFSEAESPGYESVLGSSHDLSDNPAVNENISACAYCHVVDSGSGKALAALNRSAPEAEITLYSNETLSTKVTGLADVSLHCMSCHDGETPFDAIGGDPGTDSNSMNTLYPGSTAILGANLNAHHPVGVMNPVNSYYRDPAAISQSVLQLYNEKVECLTCHDVHNTTGIDMFLVMENESSSLCLECHDK